MVIIRAYNGYNFYIMLNQSQIEKIDLQYSVIAM